MEQIQDCKCNVASHLTGENCFQTALSQHHQELRPMLSHRSCAFSNCVFDKSRRTLYRVGYVGDIGAE